MASLGGTCLGIGSSRPRCLGSHVQQPRVAQVTLTFQLLPFFSMTLPSWPGLSGPALASPTFSKPCASVTVQPTARADGGLGGAGPGSGLLTALDVLAALAPELEPAAVAATCTPGVWGGW